MGIAYRNRDCITSTDGLEMPLGPLSRYSGGHDRITRGKVRTDTSWTRNSSGDYIDPIIDGMTNR